jgi:class I fructose-bisphosphate aldolase/fructose-bisphosphate aldolase/2-amino-3,7-dideoxy-D-threo-hept-6-ulosonate synthase
MEPKWRRLERFFYPHVGGRRRGLIVPIDHGLTVGPLDGLRTIGEIASWIGHPNITGIVVHKGLFERMLRHDVVPPCGVLVHLNGMPTLDATPDRKELVTAVETAVRLGADGVSIQLNFDPSTASHNATTLGAVVDEAARFGMPVLTMVYDKVEARDERSWLTRQKHLVRMVVELGADALKLATPPDLAHIPEVLSAVVDATPVFFAGGGLAPQSHMLALADAVVRAGAQGLCAGRNVFQSEAPTQVLDALGRVLRGQLHDSAIDRRATGVAVA